MLALLVLESLNLWPLAVAAGTASTAALVWLYAGQARSAGPAGWTAVALRWLAVAALCASVLKPVILQPKTSSQMGAVVVLLDCSASMSVIDPGRTPAERVALAGALGRLPARTRNVTGDAIRDELDRLEARYQEVMAAQTDLEYARLSNRSIVERQRHLTTIVNRYADSAHQLATRAATMPGDSDLRRRLRDLDFIPPADARDAWVRDVKAGRLEKVRTSARKFQDSADEALYASDASVRAICEALARLPRLALAEQALLRPDGGIVRQLGANVPVLGFCIDRGLTPLPLVQGGQPAPLPHLSADAKQSDLTDAITSSISGMSGRPIRAVILMSDGRQVGGRGDVTSALRPTGVPVFAVGVAPEQTPDVAISSVTLASGSAFAGETLDGEIEVTHTGGAKAPAEIHIESRTGQVSQHLTPLLRPGRRSSPRELAAHFTITIDPRSAPAERIVFSVPSVPGEATEVNNRVERWVKVSRDKLKVAVCTEAPGWDFQYLRAALARSPWIRLESHILDASRPRFMSPADILDQDVLVLSDVAVDALDTKQWDAVNALVSTHGGSLILVAGATYPIGDYAGIPIARALLPFQDSHPAWKEWPGEQPAFHFVPTLQGEREALRIGGGPESVSHRWQELPALFRYLYVPEKDLVHGTEKLLLESAGGSPVLLERRIGVGRVLFLGLNETWRWRLKGGERQADQFWRQLVRYAAGEPYAASEGPLALDVDHVAAEPGEPIHVRARVRDAKSPPIGSHTCTLEIIHDGRMIATRPMYATGPGRFSADLRDLPEGDCRLQLRGAAQDGSEVVVQVPVHVHAGDEAEMRDVSGDPEMLRKIARASGGQYLTMDRVDRLPGMLNDLRQSESQYLRRPLWNSPFLFVFLVACLAGEWALRKRVGLA